MPNPRTAEQQSRYATANDQTLVLVGRANIPLACPNEQSALWASHPRVFLPLAEVPDAEIRCPYCGTLYRFSG